MNTLALGKGMPALGLGTWMAGTGEIERAVAMAIRLGYRHIDCAAIYGNEAEIGRALETCIRKGLVRREELWITSKLWNDCHRADAVRPALEKSLADLRLDTLDLYLIHWPVSIRPGASLPLQSGDFIPRSELPLTETWRALEATVSAGLTSHIGVSNFNIPKLKKLLDTVRIPPKVNQIELHPYLQQREMLEFCSRNGIFLTAYSPLGSRARPETMKGEEESVLLEDPAIQVIARANGITPAQVLLAWALARGTSAIPKSTNPERLAENLAAADCQISSEEMDRIARLERRYRYFDGSFWATPGSPYTVEAIWEL